MIGLHRAIRQEERQASVIFPGLAEVTIRRYTDARVLLMMRMSNALGLHWTRRTGQMAGSALRICVPL